MRKTINNQQLTINKKSAFTLIELLVVVGIMGIITAIGVASYNNFNQKKLVENAAEELKTNLRLVQSKAMNNEKVCSATDCGGADTICGNADDKDLDGWYLAWDNNSSYKYYAQCNKTLNQHGSKTINLNKAVVNDFGTVQFRPLGGTNLVNLLTITLTDEVGDNPIEVNISVNGDIY